MLEARGGARHQSVKSIRQDVRYCDHAIHTSPFIRSWRSSSFLEQHNSDLHQIRIDADVHHLR